MFGLVVMTKNISDLDRKTWFVMMVAMDTEASSSHAV
jgi:hypothetical protein